MFEGEILMILCDINYFNVFDVCSIFWKPGHNNITNASHLQGLFYLAFTSTASMPFRGDCCFFFKFCICITVLFLFIEKKIMINKPHVQSD